MRNTAKIQIVVFHGNVALHRRKGGEKECLL